MSLIADRYGATNLKWTAKLLFVKAVPTTPDNAVEHLLYAESKICALLKEDVLNYIVENKNTILDSKMSFDDIPLIERSYGSRGKGKSKGTLRRI